MTNFDASETKCDLGSLEHLDLTALELLLCEKIPRATGKFTPTHRFSDLATRHCQENPQEIIEAADWLLNFLDSSQSQHLSKVDLAQAQTFIGLIRQQTGQYRSSQQAYVNAAWIARNSEREVLASSLFRLAKSYGKTGEKRKMRATLQQAYEVFNLGQDESETTSSENLLFL